MASRKQMSLDEYYAASENAAEALRRLKCARDSVNNGIKKSLETKMHSVGEKRESQKDSTAKFEAQIQELNQIARAKSNTLPNFSTFLELSGLHKPRIEVLHQALHHQSKKYRAELKSCTDAAAALRAHYQAWDTQNHSFADALEIVAKDQQSVADYFSAHAWAFGKMNCNSISISVNSISVSVYYISISVNFYFWQSFL